MAEIARQMGHSSVKTANEYYIDFVPSSSGTKHGYTALPDDSALLQGDEGESAAA
jgi:hypothetical protein